MIKNCPAWAPVFLGTGRITQARVLEVRNGRFRRKGHHIPAMQPGPAHWSNELVFGMRCLCLWFTAEFKLTT